MLRRRLQAIMVRQVGDELVLLDTESNQIHQLNQTAAFIWTKYDETRSSEALANLLASEFDISYGNAVTDVRQALEAFQVLNLIVEEV